MPEIDQPLLQLPALGQPPAQNNVRITFDHLKDLLDSEETFRRCSTGVFAIDGILALALHGTASPCVFYVTISSIFALGLACAAQTENAGYHRRNVQANFSDIIAARYDVPPANTFVAQHSGRGTPSRMV